VDGACPAAGMVAEEGSFQGGEGMRSEVAVGDDLAEVE
jgi:hypothetical protein